MREHPQTVPAPHPTFPARRVALPIVAISIGLVGAILAPARAGAQPCTPDLLGSYDTPGFAYSVAVVGTTAYVADYGSGLQGIDVSDPAAPTWLGSYDTPGGARRIAVVGTTAYVSDESSVQIIDVSGCHDCIADLNGDGVVNTLDFIVYLNAWAAGELMADWNDDGVVNTLDFIAYLNDWATGCA